MGLPRGSDQAKRPRSRKGGFTPPVVPPAQLSVRLCRQLCRQLWVQPSSRARRQACPDLTDRPSRRTGAGSRPAAGAGAALRRAAGRAGSGRYETPPLQGPRAGARPVRGLHLPLDGPGRPRSRTVARRPASAGRIPFARGRRKFVGLSLFVDEDDALDLRPAAGSGDPVTLEVRAGAVEVSDVSPGGAETRAVRVHAAQKRSGRP